MVNKSSVEWLKKELEDYGSNSHLSLDWNTFDELCEQAKAMHKDEIINAVQSCGYIGGATDEEAEEYYNETFGGNNE